MIKGMLLDDSWFLWFVSASGHSDSNPGLNSSEWKSLRMAADMNECWTIIEHKDVNWIYSIWKILKLTNNSSLFLFSYIFPFHVIPRIARRARRVPGGFAQGLFNSPSSALAKNFRCLWQAVDRCSRKPHWCSLIPLIHFWNGWWIVNFTWPRREEAWWKLGWKVQPDGVSMRWRCEITLG